MTDVIEMRKEPEDYAERFLQMIYPLLEKAFASIPRHGWRNISFRDMIMLLTGTLELAVMTTKREHIERCLSMIHKVKKHIYNTIAYILLRESLDIVTTRYLLVLQTLAPVVGDDELTSLLFTKHPMISGETLAEMLSDERSAIYGLVFSAFIQLASLSLENYYLKSAPDERAINIAKMCIDELERRVGEESIMFMKWFLHKLIG